MKAKEGECRKAKYTSVKRRLYPWREWFDGQPHVAEPDMDFKCLPKEFQRLALNAAARLGVVVATQILRDGAVWMQRTGKR